MSNFTKKSYKLNSLAFGGKLLKNLDDFENLRATAMNKVFWKSLSNIKYDIK